MPDVFAHGMLSMAYLGRLLTGWVDQRQLRGFGVRFVGITHLGHEITCSGHVVEKFEADGERRVKLEIQTHQPIRRTQDPRRRRDRSCKRSKEKRHEQSSTAKSHSSPAPAAASAAQSR